MIFVRHGQSTSNAVFYRTGRDLGIVDPDLTEVGRHQAEFAAWRLNRLGVRRIITSPYKRALQTAEIIAARTGALVIVDPAGRRRQYNHALGDRLAPCCRGSSGAFPRVILDHLPEFWWPQPEESEMQLPRRCIGARKSFGNRLAAKNCDCYSLGVHSRLDRRRGSQLRYSSSRRAAAIQRRGIAGAQVD